MSIIVSSATSSCPLLCSRSLFSPSSALKSLVLVEATYTDLYAKNIKRLSSVVAIRRKNMTWSCSFSSLAGQRNSSTHAFSCKMKFSPVYLKGCFHTCGCLQNSVSSYSKLSSGTVRYECAFKASWNYEGKSRVKMGISNRPAFNTICSVSQVQHRSVYTARWINATKRITEMDIKASLVEDMKPINEGEMKTKLAGIMVDESYNEVNGTPRKIVEKEEDKNKLEQMMIEERKRQIEVAERVFEEDAKTAETSENIAKEDTGKKKKARKMIKEDKRKKKSVQKIFKEDPEEIIVKEDPKPIVAKNEAKERLSHLYGDVLVVDDVKTAKAVVDKLTSEYRDFVHACDTEVAEINVKRETPVDHGRMICFSIYCEDNEGNKAEFGIDSSKSCLWVDVLDGEEGVMSEFRRYFEDPDIKKVWHNYSFDKHIFQNHGIEVNGFYADTMHLARLWNSAKQREGGYSLEALTKDEKLMKSSKDELVSGKISMKKIFGRKAIKKDGKEGKLVTIPSVEELQRTERIPWICYSALDAKSTLRLFKRLAEELKARKWVTEIEREMDLPNCNMYEFYKKYWLPFGDLLTKMERIGVQVDRNHLAEIEKVAIREQEISASRFKKWASKYCADACYMNVNSDLQIRQLLFAGMPNSKNSDESVPMERSFTIPNTDNFIEEGKKAPRKYREFTLTGVDCHIDVEVFTQAGWPATSRSALKALAGNVSIDYEMIDDEEDNSEDELVPDLEKSLVRVTSEGIKDDHDIIVPESKVDLSVYGNAYKAFGGGKEGSEACYAIAALCEVSAINTLISNFIQPLQGKDIADSIQGRVHCSLNINTETGRLSARKPNLQNQPALEKDRYKIRKAFVAAPGKTLVVADYGQLELRILAHLANCKSMIDAFEAGGDFHSRTAMNMYPHVREAVHEGKVILEWQSEKNEKPPLPLLKDVFASERRKAKMLNFSIAYGKTAIGLSKDWKVTRQEAQETLNLWYNDRKEVQEWQKMCMEQAQKTRCVKTLLGRPRHFPDFDTCSKSMQHHLLRAAINTPVQGSAADVAMCAMLKLADNERLKELQWDLILQVHDEVILEGPAESAEEAKALVVECMSNPFDERDLLKVDLAVDAKYAENWYAAK